MSSQIPRYDLYGPIHKALRAQLCDTLLRVGQLDVFDVTDRHRTSELVSDLLGHLRMHLSHEEQLVHPMLEAIATGSSRPIVDDHDAHRATIHELELLVQELRETASTSVADTVYRRLAIFVAENLEHMEVEESQLQELLWAHFSDDELHDVGSRIGAQVAPEQFAKVMAWMLPALTPTQRAQMLSGMRSEAPVHVFEAVLEIARAYLDVPGWSKLTRELGLPAAPGLVSA